MPSSSLISFAPVTVAMSPSMALRRSPKPGAFTAQQLITPRSLLTTSAASTSPSTSSAMIRKGLPLVATLSISGTKSRRVRDLLLEDQDVRILEHALQRGRSCS